MSVDAVYIINLDGAADRLETAMREVARAGLQAQRFSAVDGRDAELVRGRTRAGDIHPSCALACTPGVIGCALSHLDVWRLCAAKKHEATLVLEDDIQLAPAFHGQLQRALQSVPPDYDILLLGHERADMQATGGIVTSATRKPRRINEHIVIPPLFYGTHCYVVSQQGASKLLSIWQVAFQVDIQLATDTRINVYATSKPLAKQKGGDSLISPKQFPTLLNKCVGELPGLNMYGRSTIHPGLWAALFGFLGAKTIYPGAVAAYLAIEAALNIDKWWALSCAAWCAGLLYAARARARR